MIYLRSTQHRAVVSTFCDLSHKRLWTLAKTTKLPNPPHCPIIKKSKNCLIFFKFFFQIYFSLSWSKAGKWIVKCNLFTQQNKTQKKINSKEKLLNRAPSLRDRYKLVQRLILHTDIRRKTMKKMATLIGDKSMIVILNKAWGQTWFLKLCYN